LLTIIGEHIFAPTYRLLLSHNLPLYWWNKYGSLNRKEKERRSERSGEAERLFRTKHQGNCALIRYADDWLVLTNGGKAEAIQLRDEFQAFLWEHLKLELTKVRRHSSPPNESGGILPKRKMKQ